MWWFLPWWPHLWLVCLLGSKIKSHIWIHPLPSLSPLRYFTNISIGGRDYSFNNDGYLSNPLLDVISYTNGRGWEEVSTQLGLIILVQWLVWLEVAHLTVLTQQNSLRSLTFSLPIFFYEFVTFVIQHHIHCNMLSKRGHYATHVRYNST